MKTPLEKLLNCISDVANRLIFLEKKFIHRHGDLRLHPSEIHLMQVIENDPQMNAGEMARALGVTTGAVSQTLSRLEKKGVVIKFKDRDRKNELTARFTIKGKEALEGFRSSRAEEWRNFSAYLESLSEEDQERISGFLARWNGFLKNLG
ncbi:MAG: MarR family transcriptional regulator [Deltaproteobacteria bacterium]|nr:MarR family transcriptional regulator [Deltaproteobacteria bacterium]